MHRHITVPLIAMAFIGASCASHEVARVTPLPSRKPDTTVAAGLLPTPPLQLPYTISHVMRSITLTTAEPSAELGQYTIRLLAISDDGTTQIQVVQTQKTLTARPGGYFESFEFGRLGLELTSASKLTGTATFVMRGAIYR